MPKAIVAFYDKIFNCLKLNSRPDGFPVIEMYCISKNKMVSFLNNCGAKIIDIVQCRETASPFKILIYYVSK